MNKEIRVAKEALVGDLLELQQKESDLSDEIRSLLRKKYTIKNRIYHIERAIKGLDLVK